MGFVDCEGKYEVEGCSDESLRVGSGRVFWDAKAATCSMLTSGEILG